MSELEQWAQNNETYLAAALAWLRQRLARLADAAETVEDRGSLVGGLFARKPAAGDEGEGRGAEIEAAAEAMAEARAADPPPALALLSGRLGLSRFEEEVLLLCAGMELDTRLAGLCARAQDDPERPYPTFALAMALFDEPAWEALSPERPLRHWQLIEINQPGAQPLTTSALRADERIVNYLKGLNYLDDRLAPLLSPLEASLEIGALPASQQEAVDLAARHLAQAAAIGQPPVIQLVGVDSLSKQLVAGRAAARLGLHLYRLPAELLPAQAAELETLARLWQRESTLLPLALYLDAQAADAPAEAEAAKGPAAPPLHRFLARNQGVCLVATREVRPGLGTATIAVEVDRPTPGEQQAAWAVSLNGAGEALAASPAQLAGQFNLNLTTIQQIAQAASLGPALETEADGAEGPAPAAIHDRLWEACLLRTRPRLDTLAQRLEPKATWDDIVLPQAEMEALRQIADQVACRSLVYDAWGFRQRMNRGLGISALFAGESGTGKTMAAEVMANDLRLNLYRIDLSTVVSKYIGETEKNLRKLFDAAEDGGAILFFDEADALFGKRSEVRDSHDRYANIEVSYLLQRMEAYRGLAILATNLKSALDHAFLRRLRFIVNFPFPGAEERRAIWQRAFPPETPLGKLDFDRLARLSLTGGSIHNIALNAAFLAARAGTPVTMPLLFHAT
ncbi:MAG: ATP-binding protein, partial [Anaerolineae bacterium]